MQSCAPFPVETGAIQGLARRSPHPLIPVGKQRHNAVGTAGDRVGRRTGKLAQLSGNLQAPRWHTTRTGGTGTHHRADIGALVHQPANKSACGRIHRPRRYRTLRQDTSGRLAHRLLGQ
jgi:hypothetical protein